MTSKASSKRRRKAKSRAVPSPPSAGGFRVRNIHKLEHALMQMYKIQGPDDLHRLAIFILAHTMLDSTLSAAVVGHEIAERRGTALEKQWLEALATRVEKQFFAKRLAHAERNGLLSSVSCRLAETLNTTRNDFIHRHQMPPVYKGQSVTSDDGLYESLDDAVSIVKDLLSHATRMSNLKLSSPERKS